MGKNVCMCKSGMEEKLCLSGGISWNGSGLQRNEGRKHKKWALIEGPVRLGVAKTRFPAVGKIRRKASEKG